jgi:uncharacterized protein YcbX
MWAIANRAGKFGSGKDTQRFRRIDGLAELRAELVDARPRVTFPDGATLGPDSPELDRKLTEFLEQGARLVHTVEVPHFDDGAVHILSAGTLTRLRNALPEADVDVRRFRPNLVLALEPHLGDVEPLGKRPRIGAVELRVTHRAERCRMVSMAQPELASAPELLREIAAGGTLEFGVYAEVLAAGVVRVGDAVYVLAS